jgi:hypothetical protein
LKSGASNRKRILQKAYGEPEKVVEDGNCFCDDPGDNPKNGTNQSPSSLRDE